VETLIWETDPPELRAPILVCSFRGWNDAAGAASTALATVAASLDAELVASVDPEEFFDFQANRPMITLEEGQTRRIDWPANSLIAAEAPSAERDLVLLDGTEPNLRWRGFSEAIANAAERMGVEMVITLGALLAEVSHTLPVPITGLASDDDLVEELDCSLLGVAAVHVEMRLERLSDLPPDREHGVQARHRILEDHRDVLAADLPQLLR